MPHHFKFRAAHFRPDGPTGRRRDGRTEGRAGGGSRQQQQRGRRRLTRHSRESWSTSKSVTRLCKADGRGHRRSSIFAGCRSVPIKRSYTGVVPSVHSAAIRRRCLSSPMNGCVCVRCPRRASPFRWSFWIVGSPAPPYHNVYRGRPEQRNTRRGDDESNAFSAAHPVAA